MNVEQLIQTSINLEKSHNLSIFFQKYSKLFPSEFI